MRESALCVFTRCGQIAVRRWFPISPLFCGFITCRYSVPMQCAELVFVILSHYWVIRVKGWMRNEFSWKHGFHLLQGVLMWSESIMARQTGLVMKRSPPLSSALPRPFSCLSSGHNHDPCWAAVMRHTWIVLHHYCLLNTEHASPQETDLFPSACPMVSLHVQERSGKGIPFQQK